jgi:hypothetical protein
MKGNELIITGNIKSVEDSVKIKETISSMMAQGVKNVQMRIMDSLLLTSTAIGFLTKLIHQDELKVSIAVGDPRLYLLLEELHLLKKFNVRMLDA